MKAAPWLAFMLLLSFGTALAADYFIVPGTRVGNVALGDTVQAVTRKIGVGKPFRSRDYTNLLYPGFTVVISNSGKQTVNAVVVTDPPYKLKNGLGIGSTEQAVFKALGKPTVAQKMGAQTQGMIDKSLNYGKLGLTIALARSKVVQIAIYARKK